MKRTPKISIIVPVYNVELYLEECLHSLEKQTFSDIEVILVNDGSLDGSAAILRKYVEKDVRFVYFEQSNQGLSAARNVGLLNAIGDYIVFVDSDDWLSLTALQELYDIALLFDADVVAGNVLTVQADHTISSWGRRARDFLPVASPMQGVDYFSMVMEKGCYIMMVYNYLYKRTFLQSRDFHFESIIHEDELWTPQVLIAAPIVVVADIDFYYYRQRADSLTASCNNGLRVASLLFIVDKLLLYVEGMMNEGKYQDACECLCVRILHLYALACSLDSYKALLYDKAGKVLMLANQFDKWKLRGEQLTQKILNQIRLFYNSSYVYI